MKRKLIWLNIALAGLLIATGFKINHEWTEQKQRDEAIRSARVRPAVVKPPVNPPAPKAVTASSYSDIASKMLFTPERNPTVVVEVPVKPPKPMPPLPLLHGVMGLPSGMLALMSLKSDSRSVGVKVGEKIGEFELASLDRDEISFQWEDKTVTKSVSEMIYHAQEVAPAAATGAAPAAGGASPAAPPGTPKTGADVSGKPGVKSCAPGDTSPAGAVADGYRKVLKQTPFGNSCLWELDK